MPVDLQVNNRPVSNRKNNRNGRKVNYLGYPFLKVSSFDICLYALPYSEISNPSIPCGIVDASETFHFSRAVIGKRFGCRWTHLQSESLSCIPLSTHMS